MKIQISLSTYLENTEAGQAIEKYKGRNLYIHFTNYPKLGVKTRTAHSDFKGIYFYPIDWLFENATNKNLYDQYALIYKYYYVVKIDESLPGILLQNFSDQDLSNLLKKHNLSVEFNHWYDSNKWEHGQKAPKVLLDFYKHLKEHKIQADILKNINWVEDVEGGFFNKMEPSQILIRNLKCLKVIYSGETKAHNLMSSYLKVITQTLGKPYKIESKKNKDRVTNYIKILFKPFKLFKPIVFTLYSNKQDSVEVEGAFSFWRFSEYHKGPETAWKSKVLKIHQDDVNDILRKYVGILYNEYVSSNALVEDKWEDWNTQYLRENIQKIHVSPSTFCTEYGIENDWLKDYVSKEFDKYIESVTDEQLLTENHSFETNTIEAWLPDYIEFNDKLARQTVRNYKYSIKNLPESRIKQFDETIISNLKQAGADDATVMKIIGELHG